MVAGTLLIDSADLMICHMVGPVVAGTLAGCHAMLSHLAFVALVFSLRSLT